MRVVLDTNVIVRGLITPTGTWGQALSRSDDYTLIMAPELVKELVRVVGRRRMRRWFGGAEGQERAQARVLHLVRNAQIVSPPSLPRVCRDEDDDKFFACALAGGASYIVSEDDDILAIGEYEGVRTIRAAEFVKLLDRPS